MFDHFVGLALKGLMDTIVSSPPGIRGGGMIFVLSARQGGATAKLQEQGWGHIQGGEDDFRQSSRGGTALS